MYEENSNKENYFITWLKEKDLFKYAEILSDEKSHKLYEKIVDTFVDLSFINYVRRLYGEDELNKLTIEELVGHPQNHFKKKLIALTETYWISGCRPTNEEAHKKRIKELLLHKQSLIGEKVYYWRLAIGCRLNYTDLEKFIDKSIASDEYCIFDDSFTWCLAVNHEYYIVVCGDLLKKR